MSTSLKSPDGLKNAECEKGQLSTRPSISYIPEVDIVMPKEEPQVFKVMLPDESHLGMPILQQGIPYTHHCSPPNHRSKGAVQEVQDARKDCSKAV